jgi:hypothetical protein
MIAGKFSDFLEVFFYFINVEAMLFANKNACGPMLALLCRWLDHINAWNGTHDKPSLK